MNTAYNTVESDSPNGQRSDESHYELSVKTHRSGDVRLDRPQSTKDQSSGVFLPLSSQSLLPSDPAISVINPILESAIIPVAAGDTLPTVLPKGYTSSQLATDRLRDVQETIRLKRLRQAALLQERERSDTDGSWQRELDWADDYQSKVSADTESERRLYKIYGYLFEDEIAQSVDLITGNLALP